MSYSEDPTADDAEVLHQEASQEQAEWETISAGYGQTFSPFDEE
ncbi:MAG: hypothetical protein [Bacteriophage sp.]|nr:MAG: hypothetical protein [Bacteriophage sp.]